MGMCGIGGNTITLHVIATGSKTSTRQANTSRIKIQCTPPPAPPLKPGMSLGWFWGSYQLSSFRAVPGVKHPGPARSGGGTGGKGFGAEALLNGGNSSPGAPPPQRLGQPCVGADRGSNWVPLISGVRCMTDTRPGSCHIP